MYTRLAVALVIALTLAGTHWRAYTRGQAAVRMEWDADTARRTAAALVASEQARSREKTLQAENTRIAHAYTAEKSRRAAADRAAADSLQRLDAALSGGGTASADTAAAGGADEDPRNGVIAECAAALVELDGAYRGLVAQTRGLQEYAAGVCVRE